MLCGFADYSDCPSKMNASMGAKKMCVDFCYFLDMLCGFADLRICRFFRLAPKDECFWGYKIICADLNFSGYVVQICGFADFRIVQIACKDECFCGGKIICADFYYFLDILCRFAGLQICRFADHSDCPPKMDASVGAK